MGLPVERFIRSRDPDEVQLLEAIRQRGAQVIEDLQDRLARKIVSEYAAARERGRKKSKSSK